MISVIIPFHNEQDNLPILVPRLVEELRDLNSAFEIILVDDGSQDQYEELLRPHLSEHVNVLKMNRQMGKGKALTEGIERSTGDIIVFMDADLQDDPGDLQALYERMTSQGYDLVNGYRFDRKDNGVVKIYSKVAGFFLKKYLKSPFSDINCGFKIFRRSILHDVVLYGNTFRFLPLAAFYEGYRVGEVKVHNKPRIHGVSKYGMKKLFIGVLDLFMAYFLYTFSERPLHFFGSIGVLFVGVGGIALGWITYERIFEGILLYRRPLLQYAIFLMILGIQVIMTGVIGELIVYLHHKKRR